MQLTDINLEDGTYYTDDGVLIDALSSVYMINWENADPTYIEILAITEQKIPCYHCGGLEKGGVSVLTNDGEIISCNICEKISRREDIRYAKDTFIFKEGLDYKSETKEE